MNVMAWRHVFLGGIFLAQMAAPAHATPRDDMLAGIARCAGIADERTFLDCVYGAAQPVRAELGLPPAPQAQTRLVMPAGAAAGPAPLRAQQEGGFFSRVFGGKVETPPSRMTSYSFDRGGFFTVTLANGEVWRQAQGDFKMAQWHKPAANYLVTVLTGAAGSLNLQVAGESVFYKVSRQH
jgi:hypothetical protein